MTTFKLPMPSAELAHASLASVAARLQQNAIGRAIANDSVSTGARQALFALNRTLSAAIAKGAAMDASDVHFDLHSLESIHSSERSAFLDEYSLGVGDEGADILVMGTEAAEDAQNPLDVAFHALYSTIVLTGSKPPVLERIVKDSPWERQFDRRPFHLEPDDYIDVSRTPRPGKKRVGVPTWVQLAKVASRSRDRSVWRRLLCGGPPDDGLGRRMYQLERSASISLAATGGRPPSDDRLRFLVDHAIPRLRESARVLLMHGFGGRSHKEWQQADQAIASAVLGTEVTFDWQPAYNTWIFHQEHAGRRAVGSRALNGPVAGRYLDLITDLVWGGLGATRAAWNS